MGDRKEILVIRHGERVDSFVKDLYSLKEGINWVESCLDEKGGYRSCHPNLPPTLPGPVHRFRFDTPLTLRGLQDAQLYGRELAEEGLVPSQVYVSPALRCIQTAYAILQGMGATRLKLNIEPGLLEIFRREPIRISPNELFELGYPVKLDYEPTTPFHSLTYKEPKENYYLRSQKLIDSIFADPISTGRTLIVGHLTSLDSCSRMLRGQKPLNQEEFEQLLIQLPWRSYLLTARIAQQNNGVWDFIPPPKLPTELLRKFQFNFDVLRNFPTKKPEMITE